MREGRSGLPRDMGYYTVCLQRQSEPPELDLANVLTKFQILGPSPLDHNPCEDVAQETAF